MCVYIYIYIYIYIYVCKEQDGIKQLAWAKPTQGPQNVHINMSPTHPCRRFHYTRDGMNTTTFSIIMSCDAARDS